jgi:hypothetical protein
MATLPIERGQCQAASKGQTCALGSARTSCRSNSASSRW